MIKKIKIIYSKLKIGFLNITVNPNKNAIWVFGFQKSGTSAIAGLLAYMSGRSVTIDTPYLWHPYGQQIKEGTLSVGDQVNRFSYPFSKDIIKEPGATFYIDKIDSVFIMEKYVFIIRNPIDNIRSILNRLNLPGDASTIELKDVHPKWQHKFPSGGENYIEDLCHLWLEANSQNRYMEDSRCILVKYEDFKKGKIEFITELCEKLNLDVKNDIKSVMNKQFQPKGNLKISPDIFFGENLELILNICGVRMQELGYKIPSKSNI